MVSRSSFLPLRTEDALEILREVLPSIPEYCRIIRIQRDIPSTKILAGVKKTNLRQDLEKIPCRDIRAREVGHYFRVHKRLPSSVEFVIREYDSSEGKEFFLSLEDLKEDVLVGYCRLRFPSQSLRKEITEKSALIRELHIFSEALSLGEKKEESLQHKGHGSFLLKKAEELCRTHGKKKVVVISGIGVREYYRKKHAYSLEGPYMIKEL